MSKVGTHSRRGFLKKFHEGSCRAPEVMAGALGFLTAQARLQIPVQILVGVGVGRVRRQVEDFDLVSAGSQPFLHGQSVMDAKVVEDQEDLASFGVADQPIP